MNYEVVKHLGTGLHGCVYLVKDKDPGKEDLRIAKVVSKYDGIYKTLFEPVFLRYSNHPNIVKVYDIVPTSTSYIIIEEKAFTDMSKWRRGIHQGIIISKLPKLMKALWDLLSALDYMHKSKIVHCDIKPNNFLIFPEHDTILADIIDNATFKLCDFSVSKLLLDNVKKGKSYNSLYRPPEIWKGMDYNEKADIWALGCSFYELLTGESLFNFFDDDKDRALKFFNINSRIVINKCIFSSYDSNSRYELLKFSRIIEKMLIVDPIERPSAERVIKDSFVYEIPRLGRIDEIFPGGNLMYIENLVGNMVRLLKIIGIDSNEHLLDACTNLAENIIYRKKINPSLHPIQITILTELKFNIFL